MPRNNHKIPVNSVLANNMTELEFNSAVKHFENFFGPRIDDEHRKELVIYSSWEADTVNAYADSRPGKVMITLYGGIARHKSMNLDGLNAVLCHELGHHFAGYPKKSGNKWSSAEGQSDYYASMKCLRRLWENEDNQRTLEGRNLSPKMVQECSRAWSTPKDQALCQRMSMAGMALALMIQDLDTDSWEPKFETPDPEVVKFTDLTHPYAQCRLDTIFQGSLCQTPEKVEFDDQDETAGACHPLYRDIVGIRPHCWFVHLR